MRSYSVMAMEHDAVLQDHGYFSLRAAYHNATGSCSMDAGAVLDVLLKEGKPHSFQGRSGRRWHQFFWEGELQLNAHLEHMDIIEQLAMDRG